MLNRQFSGVEVQPIALWCGARCEVCCGRSVEAIAHNGYPQPLQIGSMYPQLMGASS